MLVEELGLFCEPSHVNPLVSLVNLRFLVRLSYLDQFHLMLQLVHVLRLLLKDLFDLDYALLEPDLHQGDLVLRRVFEDIEHLLHLFLVIFSAPVYCLLHYVLS